MPNKNGKGKGKRSSGRSSQLATPPYPDEAKWRAECDARTLADALAIRKDPKRLSAASKAAKSMAEKQMEEVKAMKRVARKTGDSNSA